MCMYRFGVKVLLCWIGIIGILVAIPQSEAGENVWIPLNVKALAINPKEPNIIYAGTDRGVYKSIDSGNSWQPTKDLTMGVKALAINPKKPNIIFAGTEDGFYKSTDSGSSWGQILKEPITDIALAINPQNPDIIYAGTTGTRGGVYKSINSGQNWDYNSGLKSNRTIAINPNKPDIIYAGTESGVYKSINSGSSWQLININTDPVTLVTAIDPKNSDIIYIGTKKGGIYKSMDSGNSWQQINKGLTNIGYVSALAINPINPNTIYATVLKEGVFISTDSGNNWKLILKEPQILKDLIYALVIDPANPNTIYVGGEGVFKSTDAGINWKYTNAGLSYFLSSTTWIDEFDGAQLREGWSIKDRPDNPAKIELKDGMLRITKPPVFLTHTDRDRPLVLRKAPDGDFSVSGLFSSEPKLPANAWHGIFILGDDPLDFACLLFGGESDQSQKTLIGSMVQGVWQDNGHFPTGKDVPFYLKLEKIRNMYTGYWSEDPKKAWNKIGYSWFHKLNPKYVGVGFLSHWGEKTVTSLVDSFTLAYIEISTTAPQPLTIRLMDTSLSATAGQSKSVKVKVEGQSVIAPVKLFYLTGGQTSFSSLTMFDDGLHSDDSANDDHWAVDIPPNMVTMNGLAFYVAATNPNGQLTDTASLPDGGQISPTTPAVVEITGDITGPEADDGITYRDKTALDGVYAKGQIPAWKTAADWTMISFPIMLPDPDPEKVFAQWDVPEVNWQAYQFNGSADYDRAIRIPRPDDPRGDIEKFISIQSGKAAWIWPGENPRMITVKGAKSNNPTKPFAIKINSGWNQIGNPYRFARAWNKTVKFGATNEVAKAVDIVAAAKTGLIADPPLIYRRSGLSYDKIAPPDDIGATPIGTRRGKMEPWQGYWFLAKTDGWLFIDPMVASIIPPPEPPPIPGWGFAPIYTTGIKFSGWMMELNANGIAINAGVADNALDNQDSLDFPTPPLAASDSLRFAFAHPEWNDRFATYFDQDIRTLSRDGATWEIDVKSDGKPVTITWRQIYEVPSEYVLMLVDPITGASIDLRKETAYIITGEGSRKLYFVASIGDRGLPDFLMKLIVKKTELKQNFPNPFNPETWIPYQLANPSVVSIRIYDVLGRLVQTLNLGRKEAGFYLSRDRAAYWDGRNEMGERVASGVYFYQIRAGKFLAIRKMSILK